MTKRKYPSELNTRIIRVNVKEYLVLLSMAQKSNTTVAEVLSIILKVAKSKVGDESKG
jgi:hypothetical protein